MQLGAGRRPKDSAIDLSVGIELKQKAGAYVQQNQVLAVIHSNRPISAESGALLGCFQFSQSPPDSGRWYGKKLPQKMYNELNAPISI